MIVDSGIEGIAGGAAAINGISIEIMAFSFQTKRMENALLAFPVQPRR
jgi:hypothetical protein